MFFQFKTTRHVHQGICPRDIEKIKNKNCWLASNTKKNRGSLRVLVLNKVGRSVGYYCEKCAIQLMIHLKSRDRHEKLFGKKSSGNGLNLPEY
jgi:hypothetical protein